MITTWELQAPAEIRQWEFDWTNYLDDEDTVVSSVWLISPSQGAGSGDLVNEDGINTDGTLTFAVVNGLSLGVSYQLRNTVTTAGEKVLTREMTIRCDYR